MTSKVALEMYHKVANGNSYIIDDSKAYETIEKDLKILDILKKRIYIMSQTKDLSGEVLVETLGFWLHSVDKDYTKVKEWLENDC